MSKRDDLEIVEFVAALDQCGRTTEIGAGGLRFLCRQAAGMIKGLRPDLRFDPVPTPPVPNGECK